MAATDLSELRTVLRKPMLALDPAENERPGDHLISWENRDFEPPAIAPPAVWLRERLIMSPETHAGSDVVQASGMYQIDVMFPKGKGTEAIDAVATKIVDAYNPKNSIVGNDIQVSVDRVARRTGGELDILGEASAVWYGVPIRVMFRTYYFLNIQQGILP